MRDRLQQLKDFLRIALPSKLGQRVGQKIQEASWRATDVIALLQKPTKPPTDKKVVQPTNPSLAQNSSKMIFQEKCAEVHKRLEKLKINLDDEEAALPPRSSAGIGPQGTRTDGAQKTVDASSAEKPMSDAVLRSKLLKQLNDIAYKAEKKWRLEEYNELYSGLERLRCPLEVPFYYLPPALRKGSRQSR